MNPTFTLKIEGEYGVNDGTIHLFLDDTEVVMWESREWIEDPSLVYVIANAIRQGYEGTLPDKVGWTGSDPEPDADPFEQYQMYTPEGNAAVAGMVQRVLAAAAAMPTRDHMDGARRAVVIDAMRNGIREIDKTHPEVFDTAVREAIYGALDRFFDAQGWSRVEDGSL